MIQQGPLGNDDTGKRQHSGHDGDDRGGGIDILELHPRLRIIGEVINKLSISSSVKDDCTHDFDHGRDDEDLGEKSMCFFCAWNTDGRNPIYL